MSNQTAEKKKMQEVCALWKQKSKDGKKTFFSGLTADEESRLKLTGFYNTDKKNMKEPDLRIYVRDDEGNLSKDVYLALWCNASEKGKKYLSGKLGDRRVVGFINENGTEKQPYISVYFSDENPQEEKKSEEKPKEEPKFEKIPSDEHLPF